MIQKLDHIVITTKDPASCLDFYKKLGFSVLDAGGRYELYAGDFKINVHVQNRELEPHAAQVQPGSADLCFEIGGGLAVFRSNLEDLGIVAETKIVDRHGVRGPMLSFYVRDPDGNLLEFCSY